MKILKITENENFKQIVVERSFLFFKYTETYREIEDQIFLYKHKDKYECLGICAYYEMKGYFKIKTLEPKPLKHY